MTPGPLSPNTWGRGSGGFTPKDPPPPPHTGETRSVQRHTKSIFHIFLGAPMTICICPSLSSCGSPYHQPQPSPQVISIFFLLIYGLGIPLSFLLLGTVVKHTAGKQAERQTLAFFMGGFRYKYRYWEIMYMLQKMGIIVIVSFMPRSWPPYFRIYATMLLTATFLLLTQVWGQRGTQGSKRTAAPMGCGVMRLCCGEAVELSAEGCSAVAM